MKNNFLFKVAWCPICKQGWVEIVKDANMGDLHVMCNECETEWETPKEILNSNSMTTEHTGRVMDPFWEEIRNLGWDKYILSE